MTNLSPPPDDPSDAPDAGPNTGRRRKPKRALGGVYSRTPGSWTIAWSHDGKQYRETLRGVSKKEAVAIRARKMADQIVGKYIPEAPRGSKALTLGQARDEWLVSKARPKRAHAPWTSVLADGLSESTRVADVTPALIADWRKAKLARGLNTSSVVRWENLLKSALRPSKYRSLVRVWPWQDLPKLPLPPHRDRVCSRAEYEAIFREVPPPVQRAMALAFYVAPRRGEICAARWDWIVEDEAGRSYLVLPAEVTKTKRGRPVVLPEYVLDVLNAEPRSGDRIVGWSGEHVARVFRAACKKLGITGLTFHDFRHSAITALAKGGATVPELASISGHQSYALLQRYVNIDRGHLHDVMSKSVNAPVASTAAASGSKTKTSRATRATKAATKAGSKATRAGAGAKSGPRR